MNNEQFRLMYMSFLELDFLGFIMIFGEDLTKSFLEEIRLRKPIYFEDSPMNTYAAQYQEEKRSIAL